MAVGFPSLLAPWAGSVLAPTVGFASLLFGPGGLAPTPSTGGGDGGSHRPSAVPGSGSGSGSGDPAPVPGYLRLEYTTLEIDAELLEELCITDPTCGACGGLIDSGSGSGSGSGDVPTPPGGPYTGPCTCPPGYSLVLMGLADDGVTPIYKCRNDLFPTFIRLCNEDPLNGGPGGGGGGPGGGGSEDGRLVIEVTTFDVPDTVRIIGTRCVDVPACEAMCP